MTATRWVVSIQCGNGGICVEHVECTGKAARRATSTTSTWTGPTWVTSACRRTRSSRSTWRQLIIRQFKRIAWPSSKLVVQPRGGRTLVNFETNFYTPDHRSIDQSVTVAGQSVVIRAVPVSYTYYFGDGRQHDDRQPRQPAPRPRDHPCVRADRRRRRTGGHDVRGEYRIGQGEWTSIPDTLTVEGAGQDLEIVEAARSSSSSEPAPTMWKIRCHQVTRASTISERRASRRRGAGERASRAGVA